MKIVVLDGYTENPGDLSWEGLERLGAVEVYDRTPVGDVEEILRRMVIEGCPRLRFIGMLSTGYDVVDCAAARAFGMEVMACDTRPSGKGRALAQFVSLDSLLAWSDVVVLHCPLCGGGPGPGAGGGETLRGRAGCGVLGAHPPRQPAAHGPALLHPTSAGRPGRAASG